MVYRAVDKILRKAGWRVVRIKGSHHQYAHAEYLYVITVPNHGNTDISLNVLKNIEKGTGLSEPVK